MGSFQEIANNYPWLILVAIVWNFTLKGFALWYAAQRKQHGWFIALIILNTLGILEITYFLGLRKRREIKAGRISLYSPTSIW